MLKIGVLAFQGDFAAHMTMLNSLGHDTLQVTRESQLAAVDGLVLPGGESSAMLKLMPERFSTLLKHTISQGIPVLATCAGVILLAKRVFNPIQASLEILDIDVERNAYGRQVDSFVGPVLINDGSQLEGVFIRAPKISRVGKDVAVIAKEKSDAVLIKQGNVFGATFHPELSDSGRSVYKLVFG